MKADHSDFFMDTLQDGWGYDFRANMSVAWEEYGNYATDVFTREAVNIIEVMVFIFIWPLSGP